jgi:hypothetical protein
MSFLKADLPADTTPEPVKAKRLYSEYRINGRWIGHTFHVIGPKQDVADVGAILTKAAAGQADGSGNITVDFDGDVLPPFKQAGN